MLQVTLEVLTMDLTLPIITATIIAWVMYRNHPNKPRWLWPLTGAASL
jgi:hypothetical protein